jgi:hypothetical protein
MENSPIAPTNPAGAYTKAALVLALWLILGLLLALAAPKAANLLPTFAATPALSGATNPPKHS